VGRSHSAVNSTYFQRIEAVNFALSYDDGQATKELNNSDIVLVGVSRCGKTPTCLYMALQYGIRAANYPLIPEDFGSMRLPGQLRPWRQKLFGLTILPDRLHQIRSERRPGSKYASLASCVSEVREAEALMRNEAIPYLDTTHRSIEELASTILRQANQLDITFDSAAQLRQPSREQRFGARLRQQQGKREGAVDALAHRQGGEPSVAFADAERVQPSAFPHEVVDHAHALQRLKTCTPQGKRLGDVGGLRGAVDDAHGDAMAPQGDGQRQAGRTSAYDQYFGSIRFAHRLPLFSLPLAT